MAYLTSVAESKANNIYLSQNVTKEDFIKFRQERDSQLDIPKLLHPSVQVNIRAGQLPVRFSKIPVVVEKI